MVGEHDFKPEVRKQAADIVAKDAVFLPIVGDLRVEGLIRGTPPAKVSLIAKTVGSTNFEVHCSCPKFAKGQFCKHICAVILAVEVRHPDFLDSKIEFERREVDVDTSVKAAPKKVSEERVAAMDKAKERQAEYRREQSAKLKARRKEQRQAAKGSSQLKSAAPVAPLADDVEEALKFFALNGFTFEYPVAIDVLRNAKKILSRIFHPDKGGTHDEMLEMNRHFDALADEGC